MSDGHNANISKALDGISQHDDELASLLGSYRQSCKGPRAAIRDLMDELRKRGEDMRAFRVLLKGYREERKQQSRVACLEIDSHEAYERMVAQLGDFGTFGLGAAALDRARPADDLRGGDHRPRGVRSPANARDTFRAS
jgi:hypothetical protein